MALPLERMSSKERMTSRGKECGGSTKQKEPEKKNEKMGQERESWQRVEDGFSCLYSSSVNPLIRAVGPGSRHLTGPAGGGGEPQRDSNGRLSAMGPDGPLLQPFITNDGG